MARYIDADKLKGSLLLDQSRIKDTITHNCHLHPVRKLECKAYIDTIEYCIENINKIPTEDVVKVEHGEWLPTNDDNKKRCSSCDVIHFIAQYPYGQINYCPNCGAKMDGGKAE